MENQMDALKDSGLQAEIHKQPQHQLNLKNRNKKPKFWAAKVWPFFYSDKFVNLMHLVPQKKNCRLKTIILQKF